MAKIVVFSAHPDDEIIGAGGALLKHAKSNDELYWIIVTEMTESLGFSKDRISKRNQEIDKIVSELKIKQCFKLGFGTTTLNDGDISTLVGKIGTIFKNINPEVVYVMNRSDAHSDHRIVFKAAMACTKSFRYPSIKKILMYECLSETEFAPALPENIFIPNFYIDISNYLEKKIELLKIYESEIGTPPYPRSIENIKALATLRGSTCGKIYAEAFQLLYCVE